MIIIQTEAERRRREAGVQQSIENWLGSCMYICFYVCMAFANIWRFKAQSKSIVVPYDPTGIVHCLGMKLLGCGRYLTNARHVILACIALTLAEGMRAKDGTLQL